MLELTRFLGRLALQLGLPVLALWLASPAIRSAGPTPEQTAFRQPGTDLALGILHGADGLYSAQIGYAGVAPAELLAWRVVLRAPDHDRLFLGLTRSSKPAAQLYGLIGLQLTNRVLYEEAAATVRHDTSPVQVTVGCVGMERSMREVVAEIDRGLWTQQYLAGHFEM